MRDLEQLSTIKNEARDLQPLSTEEAFTRDEAETEAKSAIQEAMDVDDEGQSGGSSSGSSSRHTGTTVTDKPAAPAAASGTGPVGMATPRRRTGPPGAIPNFPSATAHREPQPFFPSPMTSPPQQRSPVSSPPQRPMPSMRLPSQSFAFAPAAGPSSPWHQLAAASGAPTPSLESGPAGPAGRSSPHLGYPFERLNIGGSWSGANLWGDQEQSEPAPSADQDVLAKYRNMAGQASATGGSGKENHTTSPAKPPLPAALAKRRASLPKNVLGGLLSPPLVTGSKAPSPLASSIGSSPSPVAGIKPISASALGPMLNKSSTLILDLRPPSAYATSHLPQSHSIAVPSTLIRRPAFTLQKLTQMLDPSSGAAVGEWRNKTDIVLVDADTTSLSGSGILEGLAGKFERERFGGNIWFLRGGFGTAAPAGLPIIEDEETMEDVQSTGGGNPRFGNLGKLAFQQESTGSNLQQKPRSPSISAATPGLNFRGDPFASSMSLPNLGSRPSPSGSSTARPRERESPSASRKPPPQLQPANPFFDNIRQNLELSHGGGHERLALGLSPSLIQRADDLPPWLAELATMSDGESAERLAEEFYKVELGEQKRLQAVMDWHSKSSGVVEWGSGAHAAKEGENKEGDENYFPYSITAGVERGTKNRYKNIWPYDHSRVRLETPSVDDGDYINASFIQPRGTARRYIATQGPLDATFRDFWTLVWEQGVSVIVMLTKQYEGGLIKCGNYWQDEQYGPLRVHLESQTGGEDKLPQQSSGFDFGMASKSTEGQAEGNIVRTFSVSRVDKPDTPARKVVQVQCTSWPDFDVPDSPDVLVNLIEDVDQASGTTCETEDDADRIERPPVLVHCSAGIGRTGTYIIVDAIIDALRRERRQQLDVESRNTPSSSPAPQEANLLTTSLPPPSAQVRSILRDSSVESSVETGGGQSGSNPDSPGGSAAGSGDSSKSVSFLVPPNSGDKGVSSDSLPGVFSTSPSPMPAGPAESNTKPIATVPSPSVGEAGRAVPGLEKEAAKMDVDPQFDQTENTRRETMFANLFTKHRGGSSAASADSASSTDGRMRRPSMGGTSTWNSTEQIAGSKTLSAYSDIGVPAPITKSSERHRTPSPVVDGGDGLGPVAAVLEGMRMQRMSLVQSLRQYLFVHKAIIQSYVNMVDRDRKEGLEITQKNPAPPFLGAGETRPSYTSSTDDDGSFKRRASPTELVPEERSADIKMGSSESSLTSSLAKRPSFKKMRPTAAGGVEGITPDKEEGKGRARKHSKLSKEERS